MKTFYSITFLLLFALGQAFAQQQNGTSFNVTYVSGHQLKSQPSLKNRICGAKEIQLLVPYSMSKLDHFIYDNIAYYFKELGLKVEQVKAKYRNRTVQVSTVTGVWTELDPDEDLVDYLHNANSLCVIPNYVNAGGQYVSAISVHIDIVDYLNDFVWNVERIDIPNTAEKFIKKLRSNICSSYNFNESYSYQPSYYKSNWNTNIFKNDIDKNGADPIEGIYKGDKYTVGVKKNSADGKYYGIYFGGADNDDWKEGDIKFELNNTATPTLFKSIFYGKWKQKMDNNILFSSAGFVCEYGDGYKDTFIKMYPDAETIAKNAASSGTGFFLSGEGYIITNNHVIENARSIKVSGINDDYNKSYTARVEITDKQNDLAILKITDSSFRPIAKIPYTFKFTTSSVGEDCFVLGYPLISSMGQDIKLTNGIISSKTGYDGNIAQYQISAPVQPGNSGGPLFDKQGNVIGIVQAKHTQAENAGYAIKASYIRNLVELLPTTISFPQTNQLANKTLPQQVQLASKAVCVIIVNGD